MWLEKTSGSGNQNIGYGGTLSEACMCPQKHLITAGMKLHKDWLACL